MQKSYAVNLDGENHQQRVDPRAVRNRKAELRPSHPHPQRGRCQKPDPPRRSGRRQQNQTIGRDFFDSYPLQTGCDPANPLESKVFCLMGI